MVGLLAIAVGCVDVILVMVAGDWMSVTLTAADGSTWAGAAPRSPVAFKVGLAGCTRLGRVLPEEMGTSWMALLARAPAGLMAVAGPWWRMVTGMWAGRATP